MSGDSERSKENEKKRKIGDNKVIGSDSESDVSDDDDLCVLQNKLDNLESKMSGMSCILDEKLKVWSEGVNRKMSSVIEDVMTKVMAKLEIGEPDELSNKVRLTYDREIENKSKLIKLEDRIKKLEGSLEKMEKVWVNKFDNFCETMRESIVNSVKELVEKEVGNLNMSRNVWVNKSSLSVAKISSEKLEIPKAQLDVLEDTANEVREREKRKNNIIIFGIKISEKVEAKDRIEEDKNKIIKIFEFLKVADVEVDKVIRFKNGKEDRQNGKEKIPPVLVVLKKETDKFRILKVARELKNSNEFSNVFINSDQTLAERTSYLELKKLKDQKQAEETENKFIWIVRGKEVVRVLRRTETSKQAESSMQH